MEESKRAGKRQKARERGRERNRRVRYFDVCAVLLLDVGPFVRRSRRLMPGAAEGTDRAGLSRSEPLSPDPSFPHSHLNTALTTGLSPLILSEEGVCVCVCVESVVNWDLLRSEVSNFKSSS